MSMCHGFVCLISFQLSRLRQAVKERCILRLNFEYLAVIFLLLIAKAGGAETNNNFDQVNIKQ